MGSPPSNLHNLMPPPASQGGGDQQQHDLLRLLPEHHHPGHHLLGMPQHLGSMKYPGTPPDTPPSSSPTSPYHHLGVITSASASGTTTIGLDVTELVWRGYPGNNNQDQVDDPKIFWTKISYGSRKCFSLYHEKTLRHEAQKALNQHRQRETKIYTNSNENTTANKKAITNTNTNSGVGLAWSV